MAAARDGDLAGLEALLSADVVVHGDGGGKVPSIARPINGREHVARTLGAWFRHSTRLGFTLAVADVNGEAGLLLWDGAGQPAGVMALEVADGQIVAIRSVVNPDKLTHLAARTVPPA